MAIATDPVEAPSKDLDGEKGEAVTEAAGIAVSDADSIHLLRRVDRMRPCSFGLLDVRSIWFGEKFSNLTLAVRGELPIGRRPLDVMK